MKKLAPHVLALLTPRILRCALGLMLLWPGSIAQAASLTEVKDLSINGGWDGSKARLVIEALLSAAADQKTLIYATTLHHRIKAGAQKLDHSFTVKFEILQGEPKELVLDLAGSGDIQKVTGEGLQDWSIRQKNDANRHLVLRFKTDPALTTATVQVEAEQPLEPAFGEVRPLTLTPPHPALAHGYVAVHPAREVEVQAQPTPGLLPLAAHLLPEPLRAPSGDTEPLAFRFHGSAYSLPLALTPADPEARGVVLRDFDLTGQLSDETAAFTLNGTARVRNPKGGTLPLLSGAVALTELAAHPDWRLQFECGSFVLKFDKPGEFPLRIQFRAAVVQNDGWKSVDFQVAPTALQPVRLQGLAQDTRFQFAGAARPERSGDEFVSYLPPHGAVKLSWKESRPEAESKLFYAAEMLTQISISPGLMAQSALLDFKVMQGELNRVLLRLRGSGEITRVHGDQVLAWRVEPVPDSADRRLHVELNQAQKDQFRIQVQMQSALGTFPQSMEATQLIPEGVTRFAGYCRVVNEGAVRLEIAQSSGLSQIAPEQFPESDLTRAVFRAAGSQRFVYRFSGGGFSLQIQADQILPELGVSQVLTYHLGENEHALSADVELDVREAPLRELLLRVPRGYALARLSVPGMADYFLTERPNEAAGELRVVYSQPVSGRQAVQVRLERNESLGATNWALPRLEVANAKSVRGHVGVSAEPGFRLSAERSQALTEIATAFFPAKVTGLQMAFRLSDPSWEATVRIERLPQTVQAEALHLFSIGEGIAYGSSVLNYLISSAPVAAFQLQLSDEYFNVEFTGRDIRNWQKTTNGFLVHLHTPVSGPYTLLATYERPFRAQGETLAFTGARPLDAQPEQGYTLVVSSYQFQVRPEQVSAGLLPLEAGEVPPEYRLFFDAPILAAYHYTSRPFNLALTLSPIAQGDSLSQVVDRAALHTRISKAGQVLTDVNYFVKNRGHPHFRLTLPEGTQLWSATVNGAAVVPVINARENLIPLPQRLDPNAVIDIGLQLAAPSNATRRVRVAAPIVAAPVLWTEWKLTPDTGQRLTYRGGSLTPNLGATDASGFAGLTRLFTRGDAGLAIVQLGSSLALLAIALVVWRWTTGPGVHRYSVRHLAGMVVGLAALLAGGATFLTLMESALGQAIDPPREMTFVAPVQQVNNPLNLVVATQDVETSVLGWLAYAWPALIGVLLWLYGALARPAWFRAAGWLLGWMLVAWAALRFPNGVPVFLGVILGFLIVHSIVPALAQLLRVPRKSASPGSSSSASLATSSATLAWLAGTLWLTTMPPVGGAEEAPSLQQVPQQARLQAEIGPAPELPSVLAESVVHRIRVEDSFVLGKARIRWVAAQGQDLPVLSGPAVLTHIVFPTNLLKLVTVASPAGSSQQLHALTNGDADIEVEYQVAVRQTEAESGFILPTCPGLVNTAELVLSNLDVDVTATRAVSVERRSSDNDTVASVVLPPAARPWIVWKPRSRDLRREKPVFYAELSQLYLPLAGVVEGTHVVAVRPAQGELNELLFAVPGSMTITDVLDPAQLTVGKSSATPALRSLWRFDPDTRQLRVSLAPAQSRPFTLLIRSQIATGPLPYQQTAGLIAVEGAAGQIGVAGFATGNEVQLDNVITTTLSPLNLEDFPRTPFQGLAGQAAGLALRRAYRYTNPTASAELSASAVQPDIRVETQNTLSIGEDRTVLAAKLGVTISRAGIFRLSFALPAGFEVESVSGDALSHWTEARTDGTRVITMHLRGKSEGDQRFAVGLAGPGVKAAAGWAVPQLVLREAVKQSGTLLIAPEQGMRLQVSAREGVTQLDPQKSGVTQKGVLSFRLLQASSRLSLDIEQVDAWIQVTSLQHAIINEALVKVTGNLQYQIENTGLKALRAWLPAEAASVRFQGEHMADFQPVAGALTNGLQNWEIKLHRRVLGSYLLQVNYQTPMAEQAAQVILRGLQAAEVHQQRGFLAVQAGGRLQVRSDAPPPALQPTDWQSIPRPLEQGLHTASAHLVYRLIEPAFQLSLNVERHPAARLLPARVQKVSLSSVISDNGVMLTQVRMEMIPGDKRLLHLTLPSQARFWFAFVNQAGVSPWREQDRILIPLELPSHTRKALVLEFFYSGQIGTATPRALDLELLAPKFDLPLEDVTWRVFLNEKWRLEDWAGSLQLAGQQVTPLAATASLEAYLRQEASLQREKTKEAEEMLAIGNTALVQGDPQQARRAFQAAFGLSQGDQAFNEDARVQLNNLKVQQALVGLNFRQAAIGGESDPIAARLRDLRSGKDLNYTPQEAKAIIERRPGDETAAFTRVAQRLVQQQEAAVSTPAAIRATIPEQGRVITFQRAIVVDTWADLRLQLAAQATQAAGGSVRFLILLGTFVVLAVLAWAGRSLRREAGT